ncbi:MULTISPECIES: cytochrome b5 domain-containing protein [unclassified Mesobacillus]|uniref:cytochrome b5 domain-containing protein n=1 Tax=unclassified Mesobacillus TaxID=2675270 RepID=UPI002040F3E5|nr:MULTISPECIES: cytochrome b5 domain-containing protein [unclassified Mesobacillus]MCM3125813.1 cytochrome b5 [Mesobacillus sp. MER 33]MCM3235834.1 cytochrome b5 [Mesobacillus sp. MER 48]
MNNIQLIRLQLNHLITQARQDLYSLSRTSDYYKNQQILQRIWDSLSSIHFLSELLANQASKNSGPIQNSIPQPATTNQPQIPPFTPLPNPNNTTNNQRSFTIQELAAFDGKNGMPAYVAVNGIVYDVTNNRAWAAATHFGLVSGREYSREFASCHAGQQSILAMLPVVGRLMQ